MVEVLVVPECRDALAEGDLPGISMVLVDGEILAERSRNTAPAARMAIIES